MYYWIVVCNLCFDVQELNPFPDEQPNLLDIVPKQVCHFSSHSIFCLGCKTISQRAARGLIVFLRLKQNIESELKWQTHSTLRIKMHQDATV